MKKILVIIFTLLSIIILNSCFLAITGAPHTHFYDDISKNENKINLSVFCTPRWKTYRITIVKNDDKAYVKSKAFRNSDEYYLFDKENDNSKGYELKINDTKFHRYFTDTILVKIIDNNNIENIHKFLPKKNLNE